MKRYRKAWLCLLMAMLMVLGMAACATPDTPATSSEESVEENTTTTTIEQEQTTTEGATDDMSTTASAEFTTAIAATDPTTGSVASSTTANTTQKVEDKTTTTPTTEGAYDGPVRVLGTRQSVDIIREEASGKSRLVYLKFTNFEGATHKDCVLTYTEAGKRYTRSIGTIYLNEKVVYDTIWLKDSTTSVTANLKDANGRELWKGTISVMKASEQSVIPKSTVYNEATLKPGSIRGVNYYPQMTPWSAWTQQDPSVWDKELADAASLNINAIRTFAECWEEDRMLGWCASPEYIATINKLFVAAEKNGIHVLFCLNSHIPSELMEYNIRYTRSIVEPFINDGRVLGWDLINEIDSKGLSEQKYIDDYCLTCYPLLSEIDPNHINNIGFAYMLEKATKIGLTFDKPNQTWHYHFYRKTTKENIASWVNGYFKDRPFILGEFGDTSAEKVMDGAPREDLGEDWQLDVYKAVLAAYNGAVEDGQKMLGAFAWCLYDYPTMDGHVSGQDKFGLIRADGSLKPAAEHLRDEYAKMKQKYPAQWDK